MLDHPEEKRNEIWLNSEDRNNDTWYANLQKIIQTSGRIQDIEDSLKRSKNGGCLSIAERPGVSVDDQTAYEVRNPSCSERRLVICEYDNVGKSPLQTSARFPCITRVKSLRKKRNNENTGQSTRKEGTYCLGNMEMKYLKYYSIVYRLHF